MLISRADKFLSELLQQEDASHVLQWIKDVEIGKAPVLPKFNWLNLAEGAITVAQSPRVESSVESKLKWTEVGIRVHEYLANHDNEKWGSSSRNMYRAMLLRVGMIIPLGSVPGHPVLDVNIIVSWFLNTLEFSHEHTVTLIDSRIWDQQDNPEFHKFFSLMDKITLIKDLVDHDQLQPTSELSKWISLLESVSYNT